MKRIICAALICALVLALGACSGKNAVRLIPAEKRRVGEADSGGETL